MHRRPAVVLDLDGVIVKSNFVKHRAMVAMFADHPGKQAAIDAYILGNGGVARRDKLVAILEGILGVDATPERLARYLEVYAESLEASLAVAPIVEGVHAFVTRGNHVFYVSSTAPEGEVRAQLARIGLLHAFARVYGNNTPKAEALAEISRQHRHEDLVFFGDSLSDLEAAAQTRAGFVGVVNERDNFKGLDVVKLVDFASPQDIDRAMREALRMRGGARPLEPDPNDRPVRAAARGVHR